MSLQPLLSFTMGHIPTTLHRFPTSSFRDFVRTDTQTDAVTNNTCSQHARRWLENAAIKMYCHLCPPARGTQNIRHRKSQYAATRLHTRAHTLWCAVKRDSLIHHSIICLTRDGFRFYVMTLTFNLMTFNVCSEWAVTWPNHVPNIGKPQNPRQNSPEAFFMRILARTHLRSLQPSPRPRGRI